METRELRYFVAVAEELHFGRAAQRGIAQPAVAVHQLERRLGVALLERSSRAVTLTEAGSVLLAKARRRSTRSTPPPAARRPDRRPPRGRADRTTVIAWPPHSRSRALAGLVMTATRL